MSDSARLAVTTRPRLKWWKLLSVWGLFLLLHFSFETFPNAVFKIIGEEGETTFFHMKMLFFAYVFVTLIELAVRYRKIPSLRTFVVSRALIAVVYPWLTITMWFAAEALGIKLPALPWELVYANVMTAIGIYLALRMEELFVDTEFRPSLEVLIGLAFATALLAYVSFSLKTPLPFFTTPPEF